MPPLRLFLLHAVDVVFRFIRWRRGLNIGFLARGVPDCVALLARIRPTGRGNRLLTIAAIYLKKTIGILWYFLPLLPGQRVVHFGGLAFKCMSSLPSLLYALFTVAAIHALLMASLEKRLHAGDHPPSVLRGIPPLLRMERLLFQLLFVAFCAADGDRLFQASSFRKNCLAAHSSSTTKPFFALFPGDFSRVCFAGALAVGWRGLLAIVDDVLAGFVLLLLSYVGNKFVCLKSSFSALNLRLGAPQKQ